MKVSPTERARCWMQRVDDEWADQDDRGTPGPIGLSLSSKVAWLQNLFDPKAMDDATDRIRRGSEQEKAVARYFLGMRAALVGKICANPQCLKPIREAGGRGKRKRFHNEDCAAALKQRRYRRGHAALDWSEDPWAAWPSGALSFREWSIVDDKIRAVLEVYLTSCNLEHALDFDNLSRLTMALRLNGLPGVEEFLFGLFGKGFKRAGYLIAS